MDLYLVMKNPFASSETRVKKFIVISIAIAVILSLTGLGLTLARSDHVADFKYIYLGFVGFNATFSILCMVFVIYRFRKHGISKSIKKSIQTRYMEFVITFALLEIWIVWATKPSFRFDDKEGRYVGNTKFVAEWYFTPITFFGVIIALSRLRDRLLRYKVYHLWLSVTCQSHKKKHFSHLDTIAAKAKLNAFLKTSLNTELVITILKGISVLAASASDNVDQLDLTDLYEIEQETTITLKRVKISHL